MYYRILDFVANWGGSTRPLQQLQLLTLLLLSSYKNNWELFRVCDIQLVCHMRLPGLVFSWTPDAVPGRAQIGPTLPAAGGEQVLFLLHV